MDAGGLLEGVRVLDVSVWRPGPYATQLLAELGADVIKVEPPGGDPMRIYPALFARLHAGKRSLVLDLKDDTDRATALDLASGADVLVEGFRPGVADRLGVGWEAVRAVRPGIVYCSISGFGQDGARRDVPGHDLDYQAWAGVLAPDGGPPVVPSVPVADLAGGMAAALAICAACVRAARTGEGERIDLAMTDVLATWTGADSPVEGAATGADPTLVPGYGTYATADGGWIALGVLSEQPFWDGLCSVAGLDRLAGMDYTARLAGGAAVDAAVADAIRRHDRDAIVATLLAAGVPVAPVRSRAEVAADPHLLARGAVRPSAPRTGTFFRMATHRVAGPTPAPAPGEHQGAVWSPR